MYETIILDLPSIDDWAKERNNALKQAKKEWVLFVDRDEEVSPELASELNNLPHGYNGFYLKRDDYFMGRWLKFGETANVRLLRFAKKDDGRWVGKVHEIWQIDGRIGELKHHLKHYPHPNIQSFVVKINRYSDLAARPFHYYELLYPILKFIQNYFFRLGILDGMAGFVMAYMMSLHSLIVRVKSYDLSAAS